MARAAARADARELDNSDMDSVFGPAHSGVVRLRPNRKAKAAWKPLDLSDIDSDNYYAKPEGLAKTNDFPRRIEQILGDETNITALTSDSVSSRRDSVASLVRPISHHSQYEFTPQARNRTPSKAFNQTARADLANPAHTSTPSEPAQNRSNDSPAKPYPDDIITVFGPNLPKPGFLDQTEGEREGEVRFVHHPNDDVSAHQWSSTEFRWVNLGQFSYERKRTEGTLAKDRLRGQTAEMSLQQHSLAYFRAVGKQREGSDLREGTPQLPSFTGIDYNKKNRPPLHTTILGDTTGRYASLSTVNPTQEMNLPTLGNLGLSRGPAAANQQPPHFPQPFTNLQDDPFVSSPPAHLPNNPGPYPAINDHTQPRPVQGMNFGFQFPSQPEAGGQPDMESNSIFEASDRRRQMFAEQERNRIQQNLWPENRQKNLRGIDVGEEAANSKERHKEAYEAYTQVSSRLSTRSIRGRAQGQGHPGAIGSGRPSQLNPDTSPGITRLLIPIFENLSSYVQGPEETRHDYWAPYVKPKAEWVDENPEKARSFFGKTEASPVLERARRESVFKTGGTGGAPQTLFERLGGRGLEGLGGVRGGAGIGFGSFAAGVW